MLINLHLASLHLQSDQYTIVKLMLFAMYSFSLPAAKDSKQISETLAAGTVTLKHAIY